MNWKEAINHCHDIGTSFSIATVICATGSTPRGGASKMVVTELETFDTIGGGELEFNVTKNARKMLEKRVPVQQVEHYPLATKANQCCGGSVTVLLESFPVPQNRITIFGAGHVAKALVKILSQCDTRIDWIDTRAEIFPKELPGNVKVNPINDPVEHVEAMTSDERCLVMTHDHHLDYRLVSAILKRTEADFVGLIGSETKSKRFISKLRKEGLSDEDLTRCVCPIGLSSVKGKLPMEIAVSVAAQLLSLDPVANSDLKPAISWKEIRAAFSPSL
jgi:xanthine dehydrogenase accessory factor